MRNLARVGLMLVCLWTAGAAVGACSGESDRGPNDGGAGSVGASSSGGGGGSVGGSSSGSAVDAGAGNLPSAGSSGQVGTGGADPSGEGGEGGDEPGGDGGAAGAGAVVDLPECAPCLSDQSCAGELVCGRVDETAEIGFCVPMPGTTECCADNGNAQLCFDVLSSLRFGRRCPDEAPSAGGACEEQSGCDYIVAGNSNIVCGCDNGQWVCDGCPSSAPSDSTACPQLSVGDGPFWGHCSYGQSHCSCELSSEGGDDTWFCSECPAAPANGTDCDQEAPESIFFPCYYLAASTACSCDEGTWSCWDPSE